MLMSLRKPRRILLRATKNEGGATAIEFAIIAPLLLATLIGGLEVTQAVMAARKVATATRTMADLMAQVRGATGVTGGAIDEVYAAGKMILAPYPDGSLKVTISRVDVTSVNNALTARTVWSVSRNGGAVRPCAALNKISNSASPAPDSFPAGMYYAARFIVVDVVYTFSAPLTTNFAPASMGFSGWTNTGNGMEIRNTAYMQTRIDGNPAMSGMGACPNV
ncbi:MAG: TadE/TadG family type IV pilus assembly protein [Beijerinckiaceae bacterium]